MQHHVSRRLENRSVSEHPRHETASVLAPRPQLMHQHVLVVKNESLQPQGERLRKLLLVVAVAPPQTLKTFPHGKKRSAIWPSRLRLKNTADAWVIAADVAVEVVLAGVVTEIGVLIVAPTADRIIELQNPAAQILADRTAAVVPMVVPHVDNRRYS